MNPPELIPSDPAKPGQEHPATNPQLPWRRAADVFAAADPEALVQVLSSVEVHRIALELGPSEAVEFLALCEPEQIRETLDLQVWAGDRVDPSELLDWVHAVSQIEDDSKRRRALAGLDVELIGLLIRQRGRLYLLADSEAPENPQGPVYTTPDRWFAIALKPPASDGARVAELVEALYRDDADQARRLLQHVWAELPSSLEEFSYRWRSGRLADLGFAERAEALISYAYLDPNSLRLHDAGSPYGADEPVLNSQALAGAFAPAESFWSQSVGLLNSDTLAHVQSALGPVANLALAADGVSPAHSGQATEALRRLHWRLSLGLEHLSVGDPARAAQWLACTPLLHLARIGHSLLLDVNRELRAAATEYEFGRQPGDLDRLPSPLLEQLRALLSLRPLFMESETLSERPFQTLGDLETARGWLSQAKIMAQLADRQSLANDASLTFPDAFRTEMVNRALGSCNGPLNSEQLKAFSANWLVGTAEDGRRIAPAIYATAYEVARGRCGVSLGDDVQRIIDGWLQQLGDTLAPLSDHDIDPRFIGGLWVQSQ